jgi:predicted Zn-ribbon and HTH transcriptional regulator
LRYDVRTVSGDTQTIPQRVRAALAEATEPKTLKALSAELSLSEKDLVPALEKLQRTLEREAKKLGVEPARCIACGFEFELRDRRGTGQGGGAPARVKRPSRCPSCRSERIDPPRFYLRG